MRVTKTTPLQLEQARREGGFTLIEVLVSIFVLTVGLVAVLGVFGLAVASTQTAQQDMIAKQLAQEGMEALFTARETANIAWNQIDNVGPTGGIFVAGFQPINLAGPDGIIGTADDAGAAAKTLSLAGPDGIVGTADDVVLPLTNYQRSIAITPVVVGGVTSTDLRTVTITISYTTPNRVAAKNYVLTGSISRYR